MTQQSFAQPQSGDMFSAKENVGRLLLIENVGAPEQVNTVHGLSDAIRADVTVIDAPGGPAEHLQSLVFGRALVGTLSRSAAGGAPVLGRLGQSTTGKAGQSPAWILTEYTPADAAVASAYMQHRGAPSFAAPAPAPVPAPVPVAVPVAPPAAVAPPVAVVAPAPVAVAVDPALVAQAQTLDAASLQAMLAALQAQQPAQ